MKPDYCVQNEGDCKTCSLVNYGRDCQNNVVGKVSRIAQDVWLNSWLKETSEDCAGCGSDIYFHDVAYEHSQFDGPFCECCYQVFLSGGIPEFLK